MLKKVCGICLGFLFIIPSLLFASGSLEEKIKQKQAAQQGPQNQAIQQRQQALQKIQEQFMQQRQQAVQDIQNQQVIQRQQQLTDQQALREKLIQIQKQSAAEQKAFLDNLQSQSSAQYQSALQSLPKPQPINQKAFMQNLQGQITQEFTQALQNMPSLTMPVQEVDPSQIKDTATMADIWRAMETSSEVWSLILELQPKMMTVERQIALYNEQGVKISKTAMHYVDMIDGISQQNPDLLKRPFKDVIKFLAIMEYDFNNGQNKDTLARQLLGEKVYSVNRQRLGF